MPPLNAETNKNPAYLLVVDPRPETLAEFMTAAAADFRVRNAASATAAREILETPGNNTAAVLLALDLPDAPGEDFLEWIKFTTPQTAVVIRHTELDKQKMLVCLQRGASDFLGPQTTPKDILSALKLAVKRQAGINESFGDLQVSMPADGWVELVSQTESEYLGRIQRFSDSLFRLSLPEELVGDLRLALEEFGRNAIEWGNRFDHNKKFSIRYAILKEEIVFVFEDEGEGFDWMKGMEYDPSKDPMTHLKNRQELGKRPGGFGLFMMKKMMDEVFYNAKGNVCVMKKSLNVIDKNGKKD